MRGGWRAGRYRSVVLVLCGIGAVTLSDSGCGSGVTRPSVSTTGTLVSGQMIVDDTVRTYRVLDLSARCRLPNRVQPYHSSMHYFTPE